MLWTGRAEPARAGPSDGHRDQSGSVSLELVLLAPVLVLLTVFVLWAGRGGRAALTADLAAEEAATAAALCCPEGTGGAPAREALVEDMLESRPGLELLCIGGLRPEAPDTGSGPEFVREHWLKYEPGSGARTGGLGVLGVEFSCETDGAVAPLRGLFPTVTFHGQASEVVLRNPPPPNVGFSPLTVSAPEGTGAQLVFTLTSGSPVPQDLTVTYTVDTALTTATAPISANPPSDPADYSTVLSGTVTILQNQSSADITVALNDDDLYEGDETLVLTLDPASVTPTGVAQVDNGRLSATGTIRDDEAEPRLFLVPDTSPCEVVEGGSLGFGVRLRDASGTTPAPSASTVTVDVDTADTSPVSATAGTDYTALTSNTVSFPPGDTGPVSVTVQTLDDAASPVGESDETFSVELQSQSGAPLGSTSSVTCTILDDEATVTVANATADEGDPLTFEVRVDRSPTADIGLEYELMDPDPNVVPVARHAQRGTPPCATGDDYLGLVTPPGTLTIPAGHDISRAVDLVVTTCGDSVAEPEERFWLDVTVASGEGVMEPDGGAMGIIADDDRPTITVADVTADEGDPLEFKVSLTLGGSRVTLQEAVTLDYEVKEATPVSAEEGDDYEAATTHPLTGTLDFAAGATTEQTLPVQLLADYAPNEGDETFVLELSDGDPNDGMDLAAASAVGTVTDDPPPEFSVSDFTGPEGGTRSFTVTLANARAGETAEVDYVIGGGTATAPAPGVTTHDYTAASGSLTGTLTFAPGTTTQPVDVSLRRDTVNESDETLHLTLANPSGAVLFDRDTNTPAVDAYGVGTITDTNSPELTVDDVSVPEGDPMTFTVTLANPIPGEDVTVAYTVASRSARVCRVPPGPPPSSGRGCVPPIGDYLPVPSGTLTLNDTSPTATVQVQTLTDRVSENPETLHVVLSSQTPGHVNLADAVGVGTVTNVNPAVVRVSNPRATEGDPLDFEISLVDDMEQPAGIRQNVTVGYRTEHRSATGSDYIALSGGSHTFTPGGATTHTVEVQTRTDTYNEDDETMALVLQVATNNDAAVLGDTEGTGTIVDADPPSLFIGDAQVDEGGVLRFLVRLGFRDGGGNIVETPTSEDVLVTATTEDGTATVADMDYTSRSEQLRFGPGSTSVDFEVQTTVDDDLEPVETMAVVLSSPTNATIDAAVGRGSIRPVCVTVSESARPPRMIVTDVEILEGTGGHPRLQFSQSLCNTGPWAQRVGFERRMFLGTADCADIEGCTPEKLGTPQTSELSRPRYGADIDEITGPNYNLTGHAATAIADGIDEPDETFFMEYRWSQSMPTPFKDAPWVRGTVTIIDNDDEPRLSIGEAHAPEGDPMSFPVSLSRRSGRAVSFEYRTVAGTATPVQDYVAADWTLVTIPAGDPLEWRTVVSVTVATVADSVSSEGNETFRVEIRKPDADIATNPPANASIDDAIAVGTITEGAGLTMAVADARGDEGDDLGFVVSLSGPAPERVTVDYETVQRPQRAGAATAGDDYTHSSGELAFAVGEQSMTIDVPIIDDDMDEADETFLLELSDPQGASLVDHSALGSIRGSIECFGTSSIAHPATLDDVAQPAVLSSPRVSEDAGRMSFVVTFDQGYCDRTTWEVRLSAESTATELLDFRFDPLSRIGRLQPSLTFSVALIDDDIDEGDETIIVNVHTRRLSTRPVLWTLTGTIVDDDVATLQVPAAGETTTTEGGFLSFVMRLNQPTDEDVTFSYETADGSEPAATAGEDYTPARGTRTIGPGRLSVTVAVYAGRDALFEHDENVELRISDLAGAEPDPDGMVAVGRIVDGSSPPAARVSDPTADEGDPLEFEVTLDTAAGRELTVTATTRDGTAAAGADYVRKQESLVFAAGETSKTVTVETLADAGLEGTERLFLDLGGTDVHFGDRIGTGTIRDVTQRRLRVSNVSVVEGGALRFEVGFDGPPTGRDITVRYETADGTATAGDDYAAASGVLTIGAGATSAAVEVATVPDRLDEGVERLRLVLSDAAGAELAVSEATGAIIDDDPEPALSVDDPEAVENGDGTPITFTLSLSEVSGRDVAVDYDTVDGSGTGGATAGDDYVAVSGATATIPAGSASVTVPVTLVDDDEEEEVERFRLQLSDPVNTRLDDASGSGTILDDDGRVQILAVDAAEAYEGVGASASFEVRLSRAAEETVTVAYATAPATATAGDDYTHVSGTLTFTAGQTARTVSVSLVDDDDPESTETFRLVLSGPSANAQLGTPRAVATILDDDDLPKLSVADAAATEGAAAVFAVTLSRPSARAVTAGYAAVADPLAGSTAATPGLDFTPVSGTVTIPARGTSATVRAPLPDDALDEPEETFWLRLTNPSAGARIDDGTGNGTIADNDPVPELSVADASATEGEQIRFEVVLDAASSRTVTAPWATEVSATGHPATPGEDFVAASGTLTFLPGTTVAPVVSITTVQDDVSEHDETFQVQLGAPTHAAADDGVAVGAILDDDDLPRISIAGVRLTEDESPFVFVVTLSRTSSRPVTVAYSISDGTATRPDDYDYFEETRTLVIPAGTDTGHISVFVVDDGTDEDDETFEVTLSDPVNAVIAEGAGTATGVILNDGEEQPRVAIAGARASEGDGTIAFAVTLSQASDKDVTVRYTTFDGTATQPDDYVAVSGTLTIPARGTEASVAVALADDVFVEPAEQFRVQLSGADNAELGAASAIGIILDDDSLPVLTLESPEGTFDVAENAGSLEFAAVLSHPSDQQVTVEYRIGGYWIGGDWWWPMRCPAPLESASGTLIFPPGTTSRSFTVVVVDNDVACHYETVGSNRFRYTASPVDLRYDSREVSAPFLPQEQVYVWDDEAAPWITVEPWLDYDGVPENAGLATFTVTQNFAHESDVEVEYRTIDPGYYTNRPFDRAATAGSDYTPVSSGSVTIPAGQTEATVQVTILDDDMTESPEGFSLWLLDATNADLSSDRTWGDTWIVDDETAPSLSVAFVRAAEAADAGEAEFLVTTSRASDQDVTVRYSTADGTAASPADYRAASADLVIEAGSTEARISVAVVDDNVVDADETFTLTLSQPRGGGATIAAGGATATATISDNDGLPVISIQDASVLESLQGIFFPLTLSEASETAVEVEFSILLVPSLGDEAASWNDVGWSPNSWRSVTFSPGVIERSLHVDIEWDENLPERDERFLVVLRDPQNAGLARGRAWGTIIDDDLPIVSVADATVSESGGHAEFVLSLHEPGLDPASLRYTTLARPSADAPARPGEDYTHTEGELEFPAGATTATIRVPIRNDRADEDDETFLLELSRPVVLELGVAAAVGTITDDDPGWTINDRGVREDAGSMVFTARRDHTSTSAVTLNYRVTGILATGGQTCAAGVDFHTPSGSASLSGSVTLAPADTEAEISVTICDDSEDESLETFQIELTGVPGRKLTGTGTITDND